MLREFAEDIRGDLAADRQDQLLVRTKLSELSVDAHQLTAWLAQYHLPHLQMSVRVESGESGASARTHELTFRAPTGNTIVEVRE